MIVDNTDNSDSKENGEEEDWMPLPPPLIPKSRGRAERGYDSSGNKIKETRTGIICSTC